MPNELLIGAGRGGRHDGIEAITAFYDSTISAVESTIPATTSQD